MATEIVDSRPKKLTLGYCAEQDRVRLDALMDTGEVLRLWLTNRILVRLVLYLSSIASERIGGVNQDSGFKEPESKTDANDVSLVTPYPHSLEKFVTAIDVTANYRYFELKFRDKTGNEAAIFMVSYTDLSLWMRGFSHCFQNAGWPLLPFGPTASLQGAAQEFPSQTFH